MKGLQRQLTVLVILIVLATGLGMPLVGAIRYVESNTITIAYQFLSEVAGLNISENNVSEVNFLSIPDTPHHGGWNCTRVKMQLTDESWVSMLIRFNQEGQTIDDVVRYSIWVKQPKSQVDLEATVRSFLSRLISKSVRYGVVYQQALQILEETGVYAGAEGLFNDVLYSVSSEENGLVLTWTKTVNGVPGFNQNFWMTNNIRVSVNSEVGVVFFGNTWDKYEVGNTEITLSENGAKSIALNNLSEEKRRLVNTTNAELFYRRGAEGRDPTLIYPCWKVELGYMEVLPNGARENIALMWADTAHLWYGADQGSYGDTSCTLACPYKISGCERDAQINVTQHIHSILQSNGYNDTYIQSPYKADIVASAEAPLCRHAVYFDGHGNFEGGGTPDGKLHVFIRDSNGAKVWDYEIYNQTTGLSNFVFLWSCYGALAPTGGIESGYAQGMGFAYSNRTDFSLDGYLNPDHKGFVFLGFVWPAPFLTRILDGVEDAGKKFVRHFYDALDQGCPVKDALDVASNAVWSDDWPSCWLYREHPPLPEWPPEEGGMRCFGDGTWTLYEDPPATPCQPAGPAFAHIQTTYNYSTNTTDPNGYELRYEFNWGDDTPHTLTDWHPSGQNVTASHSWGSVGTYNVSVRATTARGGCSGWSPNLTVNISTGGGYGCPTLFVWNGTDYAYEGLLNIHNPEGIDVTANHTLVSTPQRVHWAYLFRLVEHPQTHSYIDQVKLYAVLEDGMMIRLPLIYAWHSEDGNVRPQLLFSDDWKTETLGADHNNGTSQSINLKFAALPPNLEITSFIFQIEGNNPEFKV